MNKKFVMLIAILSLASIALFGYSGLMLFATFHSQVPCMSKERLCQLWMCSIREKYLKTGGSVDVTMSQLRQCKDVWGNPVNVIKQSDVSDTKLKESAYMGIVVWSSGPNGISENGQGDDVVAESGNNRIVK